MSVFQFTVEQNTAAPTITPIKPRDGDVGMSPVEPIRIRLEHETGIDLDTVTISVNGTYYVIDGEATNGGVYSYSFDGDDIQDGLSSTVVDVVLRIPTPYPSPDTQSVTVSAQNLDEV